MRLDINLTEYAPDADEYTQGVIIDCESFVPTVNGYVGSPLPASVGVAALASAPKGAGSVILLDGTSRTFAGTQTHLYERNGTSWTDVSGGTYTGGAESRWRFAQYGNATIATNKADAPQVSVSSGSFGALAGSPPKASIAFTVGEFVMLLNYDDGVDDFADGWWCSGIGNHEEWDTADVATQSANGRLLDVPGRITAGARLGSQAVAYKENGIWLGTYQGSPIVWSWQFIPGDTGAVSQEALVEVTVSGGPAHIYLGRDDVYLFDGSRPVSLGKGRVRKFIQNEMNHQFRHLSLASHDRANGIIRFYFVGRSGGGRVPDTGLVYNYLTNQFGRDDQTAYAALEYVNGNITWDDLGSYYSTWDDLPTDISYDSPFWSASQTLPVFFNGNYEMLALTATHFRSRFWTGYFGDNDLYTTLTRVRLLFGSETTATGEMLNYYTHDSGSDDAADTITDMNGNKFDLMRSARWHKFRFELSGDYLVKQLQLTYEQDGTE